MSIPPSVLQQSMRAPGKGVVGDVTREVGYYGLVAQRFLHRKAAVFGVAFLALITLACIIGPFFLPPANSTDVLNRYAGISFQHPFGTDEVGADLLTRNLLGGRISLFVGLLATTMTMTIATLFGALSGFFGGVIDTVITVITNAFLSIPSLLLLIIFAKITGHGVIAVVIGIALLSWPNTTRIIRAVVLSLREKEFVEAARAVGTSPLRIVSRHILPNALGPIVVSASLTIGSAILLESAISFLGVGIGAPIPTWGALLNTGYNAITSGADPLYGVWPGLFIFGTVLSLNYIGDALRDAFDPRSIER